MVVALLNAILAYFGLPLVHGVLPHSPLHVRAMADVEDRVSQGHVYLKSVTSLREHIGFRTTKQILTVCSVTLVNRIIVTQDRLTFEKSNPQFTAAN